MNERRGSPITSRGIESSGEQSRACDRCPYRSGIGGGCYVCLSPFLATRNLLRMAQRHLARCQNCNSAFAVGKRLAIASTAVKGGTEFITRPRLRVEPKAADKLSNVFFCLTAAALIVALVNIAIK